jgi:hypothetical protein
MLPKAECVERLKVLLFSVGMSSTSTYLRSRDSFTVSGICDHPADRLEARLVRRYVPKNLCIKSPQMAFVYFTVYADFNKNIFVAVS